MKTFLVTGGAGFVGSSLAIRLKEHHEGIRVIALDNLKRRGSDLNVARLHSYGVEFVHGDVRLQSDVNLEITIDCILDCAAEPSVLAGINSSPEYVIWANLVGTINSLELARKHGADFIFFSSSRVYPWKVINNLQYQETETRFELSPEQTVPGVTVDGFTEEFPLAGTRSVYGATKLASELLVQEYVETYGLRGVINRCGVLTGAWQMGKVDQGFVTFWIARHLFGGDLEYLGFGGKGKQVRDILHVEDLYRLLEIQMDRLTEINGEIFNVGGGRKTSVSLCEMTDLCAEFTGVKREVGSKPENRPADVCLYLSDCDKIRRLTGWEPRYTPASIVEEITSWIRENEPALRPILG